MTVLTTAGAPTEVPSSTSNGGGGALSSCVGYRVDSFETGHLGVLRGIRELSAGETAGDLVVSIGRHLGRAWLIPADEIDVIVHPERRIVIRSPHQLFRSMTTRAA